MTETIAVNGVLFEKLGEQRTMKVSLLDSKLVASPQALARLRVRTCIAPPVRAVLAFVSAIGVVGACSRTEVAQPPAGQSAAPPPEAELAESEGMGAAQAGDLPSSFLEPVGVPMSASMSAAAGWLEALRVRDEEALTRATRYPFEWRRTGASSCSAKQPATTDEEFSSISGCLLADSGLRRALIEHDRAGIADLPIGRLQDWARPWREQAPPGATLVNAFIRRSDIRLDVDLWIRQGAVQALWTHVIDGTPQVAIARSWLEALEKRELRALAKVTSYPFEVRDSGREAVCGGRKAAARAALESAVSCLFDNAELIRALESRAPFVEVAGDDASIPNWAERWWQAGEHQGLLRVTAGVFNPIGYSFDMILMVGPDGVRAFWKVGSLEARD